MNSNSITGNIVLIEERKIEFGTIHFENGIIRSIEILSEEKNGESYIIPGFTDSHVHVESSLLVPSEFAKLAVVHGTVATISDPHEIANVCGMEGVKFMIENGKTVPFKFHFGAPSCVPATVFETAGAILNSDDVDELLQQENIFYLSEMMNFPGVLNGDEEVLKKINSAKKYNKPVDGHAPGLMGKDAENYIAAGISTDHECFTKEEAEGKLKFGMKILIREGSAAKNFEALIPLLDEHYENMMFCSDDKHPDSLLEGHINQLCARAIAKGNDIFKVLQAAIVNPVKHYKMKSGLLKIGDAADFVVLKDLKSFEVKQCFIDGILVAENGKSLIETKKSIPINQFFVNNILEEDLKISAKNIDKIKIIEAIDGQLITPTIIDQPKIENDLIIADSERDILKLVVVNRYSKAKPAVAFIKNFGIKKGALGSTVAHDSHNIIVVGTNDNSIIECIDSLNKMQGGIVATDENSIVEIPLPVAGLMSNEDGFEIANQYIEIDKFAKEKLGSTLASPFMTLSFMALLVIPELKLSDKGLFDGKTFQFTSLEV